MNYRKNEKNSFGEDDFIKILEISPVVCTDHMIQLEMVKLQRKREGNFQHILIDNYLLLISIRTLEKLSFFS